LHDCNETLGHGHYIGIHKGNDAQLCEHYIDWINDPLRAKANFKLLSASFEILSWNFRLQFIRVATLYDYSAKRFLKLAGQPVRRSRAVTGIKFPSLFPSISRSFNRIDLVPCKTDWKERCADHSEDFRQLTDTVRNAHVIGVIHIGSEKTKNFI